MKKAKCFIVKWIDVDGVRVGYLPLTQIPATSILRTALFSVEEYIPIEGNGIRGIYDKREYALEHMRLERIFRKDSQFKIIEI